ncbi:hypothetical protein EDB89DRAFT_1911747 [Lactarius sanguifluus]|nr:hypothetical protein EDB89DRAFT_1911747 [Lactarius sanguifluus]
MSYARRLLWCHRAHCLLAAVERAVMADNSTARVTTSMQLRRHQHKWHQRCLACGPTTTPVMKMPSLGYFPTQNYFVFPFGRAEAEALAAPLNRDPYPGTPGCWSNRMLRPLRQPELQVVCGPKPTMMMMRAAAEDDDTTDAGRDGAYSTKHGRRMVHYKCYATNHDEDSVAEGRGNASRLPCTSDDNGMASPPMRGVTTPQWGYMSCIPVRSRPLQGHMGGVLANAGCNSHVRE